MSQDNTTPPWGSLTDTERIASLNLYSEQGKYVEAEPLYQRALRIREQSLGPEHSLIRQVRKNYAILLRTMGRDGEAKKLEEES
jgi:hypothetical protein